MPPPTEPRPGQTRPVTLLTDYGVGGEHVGALHLALAADCPDSPRIDLAHDVPPGDIRWGALTLARHAPSLPGAVHLAVVDPGVGGFRRAIALELGNESYALGPDNGLLWLLGDRVGVRAAVDLGDPPPDAAATFHGRDLFAPAAAQLARGRALTDIGDPMTLEGMHPLKIPRPGVAPGLLSVEIAGRDAFGNISLLAGRDDLAAAFATGENVTIDAGHGARAAIVGRCFDDASPGGLIAYVDSNEALSIARRGGNAWSDLGCASRQVIRIAKA